MNARERDAYALRMENAVRKLNIRFPGRVPVATTDDLTEALIGENVDTRDASEAVALHAARSEHYSEAGYRACLVDARKRREALEPPRGHLQLVGRNPREDVDARAGAIVGRLIARALARDPGKFAAAKPEQLTARQNDLREKIAAAIRAESEVTDAALVARFER